MTELQKMGAVVLARYNKRYDLDVNPTPMDVVIERGEIDGNGNLVDVVVKNRAKEKAEFEAWKATVGTGIEKGDYATQPFKFFTGLDGIKNIHIKTNIPKDSNRMCALKIEGYACRLSKSINAICSCYNFISGGGIINKDTAINDVITADFYWSSDNYLCLRLLSSTDFYFTTLRIVPMIVGNSGVYKVIQAVNQEGDL